MEQGFTVDAIIEISQGSRSKYELDKKTGRLRLDRVLHSSVHYPADYGFIPETLSLDGDALDVLVLAHEPSLPASIQEVRPIGVLLMADEHGPDEKILAVPVGDPRFAEVRSLEDVGSHWRLEIATFFDTYKRLEAAGDAVVQGWEGTEEAVRVVREAQERWSRAGAETSA